MVWLGANEQAALDDFARLVRERYGARLRDLKLFGSRARGEGDEDSDLDVLVTVEGLTNAEGHALAQDAGDFLTRYDVVLSPFAVSTAHFDELRRRELLIAEEIDRDGVPL